MSQTILTGRQAAALLAAHPGEAVITFIHPDFPGSAPISTARPHLQRIADPKSDVPVSIEIANQTIKGSFGPSPIVYIGGAALVLLGVWWLSKRGKK